ncbi:MAG: hypothetical protein ACI8VT_003381, partial [Saprospiraceae bacterium]
MKASGKSFKNMIARKKIAIQGVRGAFHEIAARHYHVQPIDIVPA